MAKPNKKLLFVEYHYLTDFEQDVHIHYYFNKEKDVVSLEWAYTTFNISFSCFMHNGSPMISKSEMDAASNAFLLLVKTEMGIPTNG